MTRVAEELRDRLSDAGTVVVAVTAGFSSWAGWVSLGRSVGWDRVGVIDLAWLLPISVDVYAFVALRTWNNVRLSDRTRTVGTVSAIGALALSIAGNAAGHAVEAGVFDPRWQVVVIVAALAPILLFLTLHLRVLRTRDQSEAVRQARERVERRAERVATRTTSQANRPQSSTSRPDRAGRRSRSNRPAPAQAAAARSADHPTGQADRAAGGRADKSGSSDRSPGSTGPTGGQGDEELVALILDLDVRHARRVGRDLIKKELGIRGTPRADRLRHLADRHAANAGTPGSSG